MRNRIKSKLRIHMHTLHRKYIEEHDQVQYLPACRSVLALLEALEVKAET